MMSDLSNPMVMLTYYRRLCPFKQLFLWLNHGQGERLMDYSSILANFEQRRDA